MAFMDQIEVPEQDAFVITITGDAGTGKTSLAATLPKPIFIRAEDGLEAIPLKHRPPAFPKLTHPEDLWDQLEELIEAKEKQGDDFPFDTLVLDSVSQLNVMFEQYIVESDHREPKSIAQAGGGYGAGYVQLSDMHRRVRRAAELLMDMGMNVAFICHSDVTTVELPDKDPYTRYELRLHKKSIPHYVDNVNLVGYLRLEAFTTGTGDGRKKIRSTGKREIICHTDAAQVSKNRYGITKPLKVLLDKDNGLPINPLYDWIPSLSGEGVHAPSIDEDFNEDND